MLHVGMLWEDNIFFDTKNARILEDVAALCGKLSVLPMPPMPPMPPLTKEEQAPPLDVLVVNHPHHLAASFMLELGEESFLLINSDKRHISTPAGCRARLITYGLNQKACITASSIVDDHGGGQMQICIQRAFPTAGAIVTAQEFAVKMGSLNTETTLALVGVMLVCGNTIDTITNNLGQQLHEKLVIH